MLAVVICRSSLAALATAAALGLGACTASSSSEDSSGDFKGEERRVAEVVEDLQEAGRKRDADEICQKLLTRSLVESITQASGDSCSDAMDDVLGDVDATELQVEDVTISGRTASAKVRGEGGDDERRDTLTLTREGSGWRISGLG